MFLVVYLLTPHSGVLLKARLPLSMRKPLACTTRHVARISAYLFSPVPGETVHSFVLNLVSLPCHHRSPVRVSYTLEETLRC